MGTTEDAGVRAGRATGSDGTGGVDGGARSAPRFVATETWVPGSSLRVLPDESVVRWVTNEGVLLDYAIRLRGAVDEIRRLAGSVDVIDPANVGDILERWGV